MTASRGWLDYSVTHLCAGSLDDVMTTVLMEDKVDFVRLLLQNSVVMKEYLTVYRLRKLYSMVRQLQTLRHIVV